MSSDARPRHRITDVDASARRGRCSVCGPTWIKRKARPDGVSWTCGQLHASYSPTESERLKRTIALAFPAMPTDECWSCGFAAVHPAQLDVHHDDENHANDHPANLVLMCANCHRLRHVRDGFGAPA